MKRRSIKSTLADVWEAMTGRTSYNQAIDPLATTTMTGIGPELPTPLKQVGEFVGTAWTCGSINSQALASTPLKLYVTTTKGQSRAKCPTIPLSADEQEYIRTKSSHASRLSKAVHVEQVTDHPILSLLRNVNEYQEYFGLMETTQLYLEFVGRAYWHLTTDGTGMPGQIYLLPAHFMSVIKDKSGRLVGYKLKKGKNERTYKAEEVIPFNMPDLNDPLFGGTAPTEASFHSIKILRKHVANALATYDNQGRRDAIITPDVSKLEDAPGEIEARRLEQQMQKRFGRFGRGGFWVPQFPLKVEDLAISPKELEQLDQYLTSKKDVCAAYGVPYSFLDSEGTNRANAEAGLFQHAKLAISPRIRRMESRLNQEFVPLWDSRLFLAFDNPVPSDRKLDQEILASQLDHGQITVNEAREEAGQEPLPGGDVPTVAAGRVPLDKVGEAPATTAPSMRSAEWDTWMKSPTHTCGDGCSHTKASKQNQDALLDNLPEGENIERFFQKWFTKQEKAVLRSIKSVRDLEIKAPGDEADVGLHNIQDVLSPDQWNEQMTAEYADELTVWVEAGGKAQAGHLAAIGAVDAADFWSVSQPGVKEAINESAFFTVDQVNGTTRNQLAKLAGDLAEEIQAGRNTIESLTSVVRDAFGDMREHRAKMIAITESNRGVHDGRVSADVESGVVRGYQPVIHQDAYPECREWKRANPFIPLDKAKASRGGYNRLIPPIHPNCRSTVVEVLITDEPVRGEPGFQG